MFEIFDFQFISSAAVGALTQISIFFTPLLSALFAPLACRFARPLPYCGQAFSRQMFRKLNPSY